MAGLVGIRAEDMEQVDALKRAKLDWPMGLPFIRPSVKVPLLLKKDDALDYVPARFGFTNKFASMNARDDKLLTSPLWKRFFGKSHGVVALSYFVEWVTENGQKQPYMMQRADGRLMMCPALAGHHFEEKQEHAFALCTITPNEFVRHYHDRMIADMTPRLMERWLAPEGETQEALLECLRVPANEEMVAVPTSPAITARKAGDWAALKATGEPVTWTHVKGAKKEKTKEKTTQRTLQ